MCPALYQEKSDSRSSPEDEASVSPVSSLHAANNCLYSCLTHMDCAEREICCPTQCGGASCYNPRWKGHNFYEWLLYLFQRVSRYRILCNQQCLSDSFSLTKPILLLNRVMGDLSVLTGIFFAEHVIWIEFSFSLIEYAVLLPLKVENTKIHYSTQF